MHVQVRKAPALSGAALSPAVTETPISWSDHAICAAERLMGDDCPEYV